MLRHGCHLVSYDFQRDLETTFDTSTSSWPTAREQYFPVPTNKKKNLFIWWQTQQQMSLERWQKKAMGFFSMHSTVVARVCYKFMHMSTKLWPLKRCQENSLQLLVRLQGSPVGKKLFSDVKQIDIFKEILKLKSYEGHIYKTLYNVTNPLMWCNTE